MTSLEEPHYLRCVTMVTYLLSICHEGSLSISGSDRLELKSYQPGNSFYPRAHNKM